MSNRLKNILLYTGSISAGVAGLAYILSVIVLVNGFETNLELTQIIVFSILGAVTGMIMMFFLRGQGVSLAKNEPASIEIMKAYYSSINRVKKNRKLHTIAWYIAWSTIWDFIVKSSSIVVTSSLALYIFIEGNQEWGLVLMAASNLLMFIGFGILSMTKAYDFYIGQHLEVVKELTKRALAQEVKHDRHVLQREKIPNSSTTSGEEPIRYLGNETKDGDIYSNGRTIDGYNI